MLLMLLPAKLSIKNTLEEKYLWIFSSFEWYVQNDLLRQYFTKKKNYARLKIKEPANYGHPVTCANICRLLNYPGCAIASGRSKGNV